MDPPSSKLGIPHPLDCRSLCELRIVTRLSQSIVRDSEEESKGGEVGRNIEAGIGSEPSPRWHIPDTALHNRSSLLI